MAKSTRKKSKSKTDERPLRAMILGPGISDRELSDWDEFADEIVIPHVHFEFAGKRIHPRGASVDKIVVLKTLRRYWRQFFEYVVTPALLLKNPKDFRDVAGCSSTIVFITEGSDTEDGNITGTPSGRLCRIRVGRNPMYFELDGLPKEVQDPDHAVFVEELIAGRGLSVPSRLIREKLSDPNIRLDRLKKRLPQGIRDLIVGTSGQGYRLIDKAWLS